MSKAFSDHKQADRTLRLNSSLGSDVLLPQRARIEEGISSLFTIAVEVAAKRDTIAPKELIGKLVDLSLLVERDLHGKETYRPFNGLVTAIEEGPLLERGLRSYALTLRPQLWLLSQRSDCRIWMDKSAVDIANTLLSEHDLPSADTSAIASPPPRRHYSVQWNETDLDYLLRRFEEDGLFFWFEHSKGSHKLVIGDRPTSWSKPSAAARGERNVPLSSGSLDQDHIVSWTRRFAFIPGKRAGADWNFETPKTIPAASETAIIQMPGAATRELYEYPSRTADADATERMLRIRMQATEANHERVSGRSTVRFLEAGRRFVPQDGDRPDAYEEHVIVSAVHEIAENSYGLNDAGFDYVNSFEALPARVALTPHRTTQRPKIHGTQVAIVAGPKGEEIEVDSYGRVKLWFPWDRKARKDGSDSCWVRVTQNWAGAGFGGQIIPRIGMEVICAFIDGDPDRPVVTGVVPNSSTAVPYALPANKTKSTFRTNTHKGKGFNELSFDDADKAQEILLHAERNQRLVVKKDHIVKVGEVTDIEVGERYELRVGKSKLVMSKDGSIVISGTRITFDAEQKIVLTAKTISIDADATLTTKAPSTTMKASIINMSRG